MMAAMRVIGQAAAAVAASKQYGTATECLSAEIT
jgi:hypothetical protein